MRRPKRLCMVVHGPYPVAEPRVSREAAAALAAGWSVEVVAMRRTGEPLRTSVEGIDVFRIPLRHRRGTPALLLALEYVAFSTLATVLVGVRSVIRKYTVVQIHTPPDFLVAAGILPKVLGARLVLDVHDLSSDMFAMRFSSRLASDMLKALERLAAACADVVITVHEPYRRELEARGVSRDKLVVVMNSLDERLLPNGPTSDPAPAFRLVYHGSITPAYGVDQVVTAIGSLPDALRERLRFEIHGEGDGLEDVRAETVRLGLEKNVRIVGQYVAQEVVLRRIRGASAGVIPNRPIDLNRYALSSKLFEYIALGIPVVAARLPTIREYFGEHSGLTYFEPGSVESLATALQMLMSDPDLARSRAALARRAYEPLRWPYHAARYIGVLTRLEPAVGESLETRNA